MQDKMIEMVHLGLRPSYEIDKIEGRPSLRFHSKAKKPYCMLSNFYGCEVFVGGCIFPSAEHAYQALHKMTDIRPWTLSGKFADWQYVYDTLNKNREEKGLRALKPKSWKDKNQIGILAILVVRNSSIFGLDWKPEDAAGSVSYERWRPIFEGKYRDGTELKRVLLDTQGTDLIEYKRGAHKDMRNAFKNVMSERLVTNGLVDKANLAARSAQVWGAYNYSNDDDSVHEQLKGTVWGQNVTGRNLTRYRDELLATKLPEHASDPSKKRPAPKAEKAKQKPPKTSRHK